MRDDVDFESRELCPDGDCIGVIGADGKCKVCGTPGTTKPFRTSADPDEREREDEEEEQERLADDDEDEGGDDEAVEAAAGAATGGEWGDRRLCRDGSCIGVIGEDGNCKVCGTRA